MRKFTTQLFRFRCLAIFVMAFLISLPGWGQTTVSGTLTDGENGEALPGVSVLIKGTSTGTITDVNGAYRLQVNSADVLVFSYIGYEGQEATVGSRAVIDVGMAVSAEQLSEVVITGYSSQQRQNVTASIGTADIATMQKRAVSNPAQALQGTVAGVHVIANGGNPGAGVNINIRGISSFGGNNEPLVIIDGVQTATGMNQINANDIESIQVLKDASAAAIYGSRGANGVILIQTKRGTSGKTSVTYSNFIGTQKPRESLDLANNAEYSEILTRMYGPTLDNNPDALIPQAARDYLTNPSGFGDYNWQKEIYSPALIQGHDLSVSGGNDAALFRISLGYLDQDGITAGTSYDRTNLRMNGLFNINDNIRVGGSVALFRSKRDPEGFAFSRSILQQAIKLKPFFAPTFDGSGVANPAFPDTNPDGDIQTSSFYFGGGDNPEALIRNPLHFLTVWDQTIIEEEVSVNLFTEIDLAKGLTFKVSGAFSQLNSHTKSIFGDKQTNQGEYFNTNNSLAEETVREWNWNLDNTLRYSTTLNSVHKIDVLAGFISQRFDDSFFRARGAGYLSSTRGSVNTLSAPGGSQFQIGGSRSFSTLQSIVAQASYGFDDKYLLSVNFRRDGSSRFSNANRWGNFAGGSVGWRMSNEAFWQESGLANTINQFKLRAGIGVIGRQNIGDFDITPILDFEPAAFGGGVSNGLITGSSINEDATWEQVQTANVGADFQLFGGKVSGSFEYYNSTTTDMIIDIPIAASVGGGVLKGNTGKLTNNGVELTLNYNGKVGNDLTFSTGFNLGTQNPILEEIGTDLIILGDAGPEWDVPHVMEIHEGGGVAEFWVIQTDGIFKSAEDVQAHQSSDGTVIQPNAQPGDIRFIDADDDGEISSEGDRRLSGSGVPNVNVGYNLTVQYKNFDFSLILTGAFGHQIYNSHEYLVSKTDEFGNFGSNLLNAFDPVTNPNSNFPRLNPNDIDDNWNARPQSDRFIENGAYMKVRNLEIGYTLPKDISQKVSMENARIFIRGQNIWTISGFGGIDPEVGQSPFVDGRSNGFTQGLDRDTAPQTASFQGGISVTF